MAFNPVTGDPDAEYPLVIWTSNESGGMELSTDFLIKGGIPSSLRGFRQIIPADFNGDGRLDLFLESHGPEWDCGDDEPYSCWPGGQNNLLLSDGQGKLNNVTTTNLPAFSDFSHGSTVLDFDGDGDMDIWVNNAYNENAEFYPKSYLLLENDGFGAFTVIADSTLPWMPVLVGHNGILPGIHSEGLDWATSGWPVAIDANGDGNTDLDLGWNDLFTEYGPPTTFKHSLLLSDGEGHFDSLPVEGAPKPSWADIPTVQHALVYDLNNDGLDDQLLQVSDEFEVPEWMQVLISNGDGTFRDETSTRYPFQDMSFLSDFQLHDLDGDGHPDMFVNINWDQVDVRVNDGEGNFRLLSNDWVEMSHSWVVLDVDNDGGTDFFESSYLGLRLHKMNLPYGPEMDGTDSDDRLIGGAHDNVYRGLKGNDVLDGGLGDDDLDGGTGNDELIGGKGNDYLIPGNGTNTIDGGPGRDLLDYPFPIAEAEILPDEITFIRKTDDSVNDEITNTEFAKFTDAATPLPTQASSGITGLSGIAGLWYDPSLDGEGFNIIPSPFGAVVFFYGYTAEGEQLWLVSETFQGDIGFEGIVDLQMYEGVDGTFEVPADPPDGITEWGRLKMLFDGCGTARFALHGADGVKTSYGVKLAGISDADCERQVLAPPSGLAGLWYDPDSDGEGLNFIVMNGNTLVFYYGYTADGERLWLVSETKSGVPNIDQPITIQMYTTSGGTFDAPAKTPEALIEWGEMVITFTGCTEATVTLNGIDGNKSLSLVKLAGIVESSCPQ